MRRLARRPPWHVHKLVAAAAMGVGAGAVLVALLMEASPAVRSIQAACGVALLALAFAYGRAGGVRTAAPRELVRLADSLPAMVALLDDSLRLRYVNRQFERWCGAPRGRLSGRPAAQILGAHADALLPVLEGALENRPGSVEMRGLWPEDGGVHVRAECTPWRRGGRVSGVTLMIHDITPHKRVERTLHEAVAERTRALELEVQERRHIEIALRNSETRFRDIAEAASDWFWETGPDLRFTYFSGRIQELLGIDPASWVGRRRTELAVPEDRPRLEEHMKLLEARQPFRDLHYRIRSPLGVRHIKISGKPAFAEDGTFLGYRGTGTDVTQQVENELCARQAQERLQAAVDGMSDGLALWDVDDRLLLCNDALRAIFPGCAAAMRPGISYVEMMRRAADAGDLVVEDLPKAWLAECVESHLEAAGSRERRLSDDRWVLIVERRTAQGQIIGIYTDITQRKQAERALEAAKEQAELANRTKSEFLANMSHELRTPLNAIIGFSEMMTSRVFGALGDERYEGYARSINDSGRHLLEVINDILDVSKIEAGRLELSEDEVAVPQLVRAALRLVRERAQAGDVALEVDVADNLPRLHGDQRRLKQVLLNLLSNAIKFTAPEGRVTVVATRRVDGWVALAVQDTGIGMTPEEIHKALTPFGQVDSRLSRRHEGTGLGLPLSRSLVALHDGELTVASEPGVGTAVTVAFPPHRLIGGAPALEAPDRASGFGAA